MKYERCSEDGNLVMQCSSIQGEGPATTLFDHISRAYLRFQLDGLSKSDGQHDMIEGKDYEFTGTVFLIISWHLDKFWILVESYINKGRHIVVGAAFLSELSGQCKFRGIHIENKNKGISFYEETANILQTIDCPVLYDEVPFPCAVSRR